MTLFFRYIPQLIEAGMLYVGCPPLFKLHQGKNITYCMNDKELQKETEKLRSKNIKYSVTRFKGLGEMNPEDLRDTTLDKKTRILKRVTITDKDMVDNMVSKLMGAEAKGRKEVILREGD